MELGMKGGMRECPLAAAALIFVALTIAAPPPTAVRAEEELQPTVKIAVAVSLTGASNVFGVPALDGARLAVDEANVEGLGPHLDLEPFDDASDPDKRYRTRFGPEPDYLSVLGYQSALFAINAVRSAVSPPAPPSVPARRTAVYPYLKSLDGPSTRLTA